MVARPLNDGDYARLPGFFKRYSQSLHHKGIRLPPEFVGRHGGGLPHQCILVMPRRRIWGVTLLKIANGYFFRNGWRQFVEDNNITHLDFLTFTWLGGGTFHVKRYDFGSGCPPKIDFNVHGVCSPEEDYYSPDIESSDDNYPPGSEGDTDSDEVDAEDMVVPGEGEYPSFKVTLTKKKHCWCLRTASSILECIRPRAVVAERTCLFHTR
ncbi:B3 domain-containing protein At3g06220-like [Salvia hispanica]|uniref:B3 domain-containing protein At3g06220-like n=1 Tax=Salvia hispanica TaxID=49212 RepID=UPI0020093235|nr:B3 domain-containing protein At3g06220-like [Salvia hispanica]